MIRINSFNFYLNVKLVFLPPNTTSQIQPMDPGMIANFKKFNRLLVIRKLLSVVLLGGCRPHWVTPSQKGDTKMKNCIVRRINRWWKSRGVPANNATYIYHD